MNEILRLSNQLLRNEEYFKHKLETLQTVDRPDMGLAHLEPIIEAFRASVNEVDLALEQIRKSAYTELIDNADNNRDNTTTGFVNAVKSFSTHFDARKREKARELKIITDHFKGINRQSVASQTASTINMIQELRAKSHLLETLGLIEWVDQIENENNIVASLTMNRFEESAFKSMQRMKEVRPKCDKQLESLYKAIETFATLTPADNYNNCISMINTINKKYADTIALRRGIAAAKNNEPDPTETV